MEITAKALSIIAALICFFTAGAAARDNPPLGISCAALGAANIALFASLVLR